MKKCTYYVQKAKKRLEMLKKCVQKRRRAIFLILMSVHGLLMLFLAFGVGFMFGSGFQKQPLVVSVPEAIGPPVSNSTDTLQRGVLAQKKPLQNESVSAQEQNFEVCPFVASATGSKYYPQGCAGINRIKPENRVCYASEEEAAKEGLELSKTCK
jgi:hypothetical protein